MPVLRAIVALALCVLLMAGCGADSRPERQEPAATAAPSATATPAASPTPEPAIAHLDGIPQDGLTLGSPDAHVTLVEYVDLNCPVCARYMKSTSRELIAKYVRDGKVKIEVRHYAILGPASKQAARWQLAAAAQNRGYEFLEAYYADQPAEGEPFDQRRTVEIARRAGLDVDQLLEGVKNPQLKRTVTNHGKQAKVLRLPGTPGFVLEGPEGTQLMAGLISFEQAEAAISAVTSK